MNRKLFVQVTNLTWKKPTIEYIRSKFAEEGYTLHSKEYKNNRDRLEYTCPNGHVYSISWVSWVIGSRCGPCANNIKLTVDFVKEAFHKEGYVLLSTDYYNAHTKLDYICSFGHKHSISWSKWKKGKRCPVCANIRLSVNSVGSGNPNWRGGITCDPYCESWSDKKYKEDIKSRDGHKCLNPTCNSKNPTDLTIHHIDYSKKNCEPSNLITICRSCNTKANKDRDWHIIWYKSIMFRRYNFI